MSEFHHHTKSESISSTSNSFYDFLALEQPPADSPTSPHLQSCKPNTELPDAHHHIKSDSVSSTSHSCYNFLAFEQASAGSTTSPNLRSSFSSSSSSSSSPCPSSTDSDSDDSDYAQTQLRRTRTKLRVAIATAPVLRLRAIIEKLTDANPAFERAVYRELVPASPLRTRKPLRKGTRRVRIASCVNCGENFDVNGGREEAECCFHPGELEDERYEFMSRTPDGRPFEVVKNVTMWSCCEGDGWSVGCLSTTHARREHVEDSDDFAIAPILQRPSPYTA